MFAIIGNLAIPELLIIAAGAVIVFGRRLPEVTMRGAAHLIKLRRTVTEMWREAGLEEELRRVRREIDEKVQAVHVDVPRLPSTKGLAQDFFERAPDSTSADSALPTGPGEHVVALGEDHADHEHDDHPMDDSYGPSEEERRAEAGKDVAGADVRPRASSADDPPAEPDPPRADGKTT